MELLVRPAPTRFSTNSRYTPIDNTPLHFMSSMCHPWGCCYSTVVAQFGICIEHRAERPEFVNILRNADGLVLLIRDGF